MQTKTVLVVDPSIFVERLIRNWLPQHQVIWAASLAEAEKALNRQRFDCALISLELPDSQGLPTFYYLEQLVPALPFIVMKDKRSAQQDLNASPREARALLIRQELNEAAVIAAVNTVFGAALGGSENPELAAC
jgi:DNA-binding NtrC family response regulator